MFSPLGPPEGTASPDSRRYTVSTRLAVLLVLSFLSVAAPVARAGSADELRLVVVVVVDQFRGDALERYYPLLGTAGLRRLCEGGVWYQNAHYTHGHTVTGVGHATIGTGARPAGHGIVANEWVDRTSGARVGCVADAASQVVGTASETGNASPIHLRATTFADEWGFATLGSSRAFGVSGKDRGAILPVGKGGKAFWYSTVSGRMVSSRYYYPGLPPWAREFSEADPSRDYFGKTWERATRDDDGVPSAPDDRAFEHDLHGMGKTFPHPLGKEMKKPEANFYEQVKSSPFGDEIVMEFALRLLREEELGQRGVLDVLSISLSSNDPVGHNFGPDSVECKEMAHHIDRQLARLLLTLDERIGEGGYLLVFTADHGVAYSPEVATAEGFSVRRYKNSDLLRAINRRLSFRVRYLDWSVGFAGPGYYFDPEALVYGGRPAAELESMVADVIRESPGIAAAYTRTEILAGRLPDTDVARRVHAAYDVDRSPDVYVVPEAYWIEGTGTASHGTPYNYDTHVPLIFYGAGITPAETTRPADMMDVAPTITAVLGCTPPSASEGRPLEEVVGGIRRKPSRPAEPRPREH